MWASKVLIAALISDSIKGAHHEHDVQVSTLPPGVLFRSIIRFIVMGHLTAETRWELWALLDPINFDRVVGVFLAVRSVLRFRGLALALQERLPNATTDLSFHGRRHWL